MEGDRTIAVVGENSGLKYWNIFGNDLAGKHLEPSNEMHYYIKDHLGSIRAIIDDAGEIMESHDYYPFGLLMPTRSYVSGERNKELFTGKERDVETGRDYFGARYYDPAIARWLSVDPLAYKTPSKTPYHYVSNNPINRLDPDGREDWSAAGWAVAKGIGGGSSFVGGWALQLKGVATCAASAGTLSPLGIAEIIGGEGLKVWGAIEVGFAVQNYKFAMAVPDGTDADALGNIAYELAHRSGINKSKSSVIGFLTGVLTGAPGIAKSALDGQGISLIIALINSGNISKDLVDMLKAFVEKNSDYRFDDPNNNNNNNNNSENSDNSDANNDSDDDDDNNDDNNNDWFTFGAENQTF